MKLWKQLRKPLALLLGILLACGLLAGCDGGGSATPTPIVTPTAAPTAKPTHTSFEIPTEIPEEAPTEAPTDSSHDQTKESVALSIWGSREDQPLLGEMIETFKSANPEKNYEITLGVVNESEAAGRLLDDPESAADVFSFANDQILLLTNENALYEITTNKDSIIAANLPGSIDAATVQDMLYAYPMTADNGYFLYYDKSVISDEQAGSIDGILAACAEADKKFYFDITDGWYLASFFLGAGCELWIEDGIQKCDFNNEKGVAAGEAVKKLAANGAHILGNDSTLPDGIGDAIAAGVSGIWNAQLIRDKLGNNYGATKLPTFTCDGKQIQLSGFAGYKLVGVNNLTRYPQDAMALARWITNEQNQLLRFQQRALLPSNLNAIESYEVKANIAQSALAHQERYAVSQKEVLGSYWTPAQSFGIAMTANDYGKSIKELLDDMVAKITAKV